ncbi:uncharacterized [Tachysurus ichikawai]
MQTEEGIKTALFISTLFLKTNRKFNVRNELKENVPLSERLPRGIDSTYRTNHVSDIKRSLQHCRLCGSRRTPTDPPATRKDAILGHGRDEGHGQSDSRQTFGSEPVTEIFSRNVYSEDQRQFQQI